MIADEILEDLRTGLALLDASGFWYRDKEYEKANNCRIFAAKKINNSYDALCMFD